MSEQCAAVQAHTPNEDSTPEMNRLLETPGVIAAAAPIRTPANLSQRILVVEDDTAKHFSPRQLLDTVEEVLSTADPAGFGHKIRLPARRNLQSDLAMAAREHR
jgi:hypothetical protein